MNVDIPSFSEVSARAEKREAEKLAKMSPKQRAYYERRQREAEARALDRYRNETVGRTACVLLGVKLSASMEEITAAYRKLAQTRHPDKGGDTESWARIQTAYTALKQTRKVKVITKSQFDQAQRGSADGSAGG